MNLNLTSAPGLAHRAGTVFGGNAERDRQAHTLQAQGCWSVWGRGPTERVSSLPWVWGNLSSKTSEEQQMETQTALQLLIHTNLRGECRPAESERVQIQSGAGGGVTKRLAHTGTVKEQA